MKNVLMISYFAPPLNLPSAIRVGKFAKYLPEFGWSPIILSVKDIGFYLKDDELYKEVKNLNIHRTESLDYFRLMKLLQIGKSKNLSENIHRSKEKITNFIKSLFPIDDKIGWMPFCYSKAKKIIKKNHIQIIFVSIGGVHHQAITAYFLAKKFDIPLILEFRDLWADHPFIERSYFGKLINNYWEKKVIDYATRIISLAPKQREFLKKKYNIYDNKIEYISNGYDEDYFNRKFPQKKEKGTLILTFCGGFYKNLTPSDLFNSFLRIKENRLKIIIRFIGNFRNQFFQLKKQYESKSFLDNISIEVIPRISYIQLLEKLHLSDVLMLFLPKDNKYDLILHAKLFDYMAIRKPIIAFCPKNSDVENIVNEGNLGFIVEAGNVDMGTKKIEEIIRLFKQNKLKEICGSDKFISQFTQRKATEKLVKVLNSVVKK